MLDIMKKCVNLSLTYLRTLSTYVNTTYVTLDVPNVLLRRYVRVALRATVGLLAACFVAALLAVCYPIRLACRSADALAARLYRTTLDRRYGP